MSQVAIAGIEKLTTRPEKRLVKALEKAETQIAVLESNSVRGIDEFRRLQLIEQFTHQQEQLTAEIKHIVASKIAREELDKFEVKEVITNKEATLRGYNHDLAKNPASLKDAKSVRELSKKRYITLASLPIKEYESGSERLEELSQNKPWVAILNMPGSKNNYHVATPTEFRTEQQKLEDRQKWLKEKPIRKRQHRERLNAIKEANRQFAKDERERKRAFNRGEEIEA